MKKKILKEMKFVSLLVRKTTWKKIHQIKMEFDFSRLNQVIDYLVELYENKRKEK